MAGNGDASRGMEGGRDRVWVCEGKIENGFRKEEEEDPERKRENWSILRKEGERRSSVLGE